jgi:hypothetical protein
MAVQRARMPVRGPLNTLAAGAAVEYVRTERNERFG